MTSTHHEPDLDPAADGHVTKTPVEARQGVTTRHVRWVLGISLSLVVVVLGAALVTYDASQPKTATPATAAADRR
jgi:ferric-dicitrate binding protein FerR (iron transport regulator)